MNWYRLRLNLRGPTGTPWQADTIFGHLCWALRHRRGEVALREFLGYFWEGQPLFLLSDGFAGGLLPLPVGTGLGQGEGIEGLRQARAARKLRSVGREDFLRAVRGESFVPAPVELQEPRVTLKNQISRLTG